MGHINIIDNAFAHVTHLAEHHPTNNVTWNRHISTFQHHDFVVFSDNNIPNAPQYPFKKIAFLLEPISIQPGIYEWIKNNHHYFSYILTYDEELLKINDKFIFYPYGTSWIEQKDIMLHTKNKLISIIASDKMTTDGHRLRHEVISRHKDVIDLFGKRYNPIDSKIIGMKDYAFQIVIENTKRDFYFTEKIIDCFTTGTIPIYWGCPSIGKFFDINGILTFDSLPQLDDIMNTLSFELYQSKLESIKTNFTKSIDFIHLDNYIYNKINTLK